MKRGSSRRVIARAACSAISTSSPASTASLSTRIVPPSIGVIGHRVEERDPRHVRLAALHVEELAPPPRRTASRRGAHQRRVRAHREARIGADLQDEIALVGAGERAHHLDANALRRMIEEARGERHPILAIRRGDDGERTDEDVLGLVIEDQAPGLASCACDRAAPPSPRSRAGHRGWRGPPRSPRATERSRGMASISRSVGAARERLAEEIDVRPSHHDDRPDPENGEH